MAVKYFRIYGIKLRAIIDNDIKKIGNQIEGIDIISVDKLDIGKEIVFVSVTDHKNYNNIIKQLKQNCNEYRIISWRDIYSCDT